MRNTRKGWKEIESNSKRDKQEKEVQWKLFEIKTKKLSKKGQKLENEQRKIKTKWATWLTHTMSCKILGTRKLKRGSVMT